MWPCSTHPILCQPFQPLTASLEEAPQAHTFTSVTNFFLKKECGRGQQELKSGSQSQPSSALACVVLAGLPGPRASPALSKGCRGDKSSAAGGGGWGGALWGPHWGPSPLRTILSQHDPSAFPLRDASPFPPCGSTVPSAGSWYSGQLMIGLTHRFHPPCAGTLGQTGPTRTQAPQSSGCQDPLWLRTSFRPCPPPRQTPACTGPFPCLVRCPGSCPSWPVRSQGPWCPDSCSYRAFPREFATAPSCRNSVQLI